MIWRVTLSSVKQLVPTSHYALLALLFVVGLELILLLQRWIVAVGAVTVAVVVVGTILIRLEEKDLFRPVQVVLPILATTGLSGFAFLLPTTVVLHGYITAAGLALFFLLKHGARAAYPMWNWALSLVIYFVNVAFVLGLRFHLDLPVLLSLLLVGIVTLLASYQALTRVMPTLTISAVPVLGMTLALTEIAWVMQFLPVHYLVQAGFITTLYYIIFNLVSISYMKTLKRRDVLEYVGIGVVASLIIFVSAQWL